MLDSISLTDIPTEISELYKEKKIHRKDISQDKVQQLVKLIKYYEIRDKIEGDVESAAGDMNWASQRFKSQDLQKAKWVALGFN